MQYFEIVKLIEENKCYSIDLENTDINILNEFIYDDIFFNHIVNLPINIIDELVNRGLIFPIKNIKNNTLIDKYMSLYDIESLRCYIEHLKTNNICIYKILDKKLREKCDYIARSINDNEILEDYHKIYLMLKQKNYNCLIPTFFAKKNISEISEDDLRYQTKEILMSALCDRFFKDYKANVLINLRNILNFRNKNQVIPDYRLKMYRFLLDYKYMYSSDLKYVYSKLDDNYGLYLYEDIRKIKDLSYDLINDNIINLDEMDFKVIDGIKVYYVDEKYYIPIHTTQIQRSEFDYNTWKKLNKKETISISIISENNQTTYTNPSIYASFGMKKLDKNKIIHVYNEDSYSSETKQIDKVNLIMTLDELMNSTNGYNEIVLLDCPFDYQVCFDNVCDYDINISKSLNNMPIVVVKSLKKNKNYIRKYDYKRYRIT